MPRPFLLIIISFYIANLCFAQTESLQHFGTSDGISSNSVGPICIDYSGLLWLGTSRGLNSYNGREWKNFTTNNGLAGNFITEIHEDEENILWVKSQFHELAYKQGNEFHVIDCDSNFPNNGRAIGFQPLNRGKIRMLYQKKPHIIDVDTSGNYEIIEPIIIDSFNLKIDGYELKLALGENFSIISTLDKREDIFVGNNGESSNDSEFHYIRLNKDLATLHYKEFIGLVRNQKIVDTYTLPVKEVFRMEIFNDTSVMIVPDYEGIIHLSINSDQTFQESILMKDMWPSACPILDIENGMWFPEFNSGSFYSSHQDIFTLGTDDGWDESPIRNVYCDSLSYDSIILYIGDQNPMLELNLKTQHFNLYESSLTLPETTYFTFRDSIDNIFYAYGTGRKYYRYEKDFFVKITSIPSGSFSIYNNKKQYTSDGEHLIFKNKNDALDSVKMPDYISSKVLFEGLIYCATNSGIYTYDYQKDKVTHLGNDIPAFNEKISRVRNHKKQLWIGTWGHGLWVLKNGAYYNLNQEHGICSDIIGDIKIAPNGVVWIETTNGINKIYPDDGDPDQYRVLKLDLSNGLPSLGVTNIGFCGGSAWVGSDLGLSSLPLDIYDTDTIVPNVSITNTFVNSNTYDFGKSEQGLDPDSNDIEIHFNTLTYRYRENLKYRYRLKGGDNKDWSYTKSNYIRYHELRHGDYIFEIQAGMQNKFWSNKVSKLEFTILPPFYLTWWFILSCILASTGSLALFIITRFKRLKQQYILYKQLDKIRHQMLNAQMNPHFVFNSLTSVQKFILQDDQEASQDYLEKFARLIRVIFENSQEDLISIMSEMDAIHRYLDLEKVRIGKDFNYDINISDETSMERVMIPPLLLQPFVENAIIHGFQHAKVNSYIEIEINKSHDLVNIFIRDNGIGRKKSAEIKNKKNNEHNSRGMSLTEERIILMQKLFSLSVDFKVTDLSNFKGSETGTEIKISFNTNEFLKEYEE